MSVRSLHPLDAPRQLLPGRLAGENLAVVRGQAGRPPERLTPARLVRRSAAPRSAGRAVVSVDGALLDALVEARPRSGPRSWEVARLFAKDNGERLPGALFDLCASRVAEGGGERLFLRTPLDAEADQAAQRAQFARAHVEEAYRTDKPLRFGAGGATLLLRPALPSDEQALFRLYNATVPASVRSAAGLTVEQWCDSQERAWGEERTYLWEDGGQIRGWVRLAHRGEDLIIDALLHPDETAAAPALAGDAARLAWGHARAVWTVEGYQPALALALKRAGWESGAAYSVLARPVAKRVDEPALALARA
ncbi:MAG: hypothetical protein OXI25_02360 [Chloroflexota bacterium]|nr:hypothetical protein [Chloroflexota bacterium]